MILSLALCGADYAPVAWKGVCHHGRMLGGRSIRLARIFGIRVGVDVSWFVFLFLVIWLETGYYRDQFPGHDTRAFELAVLSAFLFFLSILLHELGHAAAARMNGIGIAGIDLFMFGGVARMRRDSTSPGVDLAIAIAGPIVTLAIAGLCFVIGAAAVGVHDFVDVLRYRAVGPSAGTAVVADVGRINAILFVFNLLPGLPLDGGRVVRAIAWWRTGDRTRATLVTARSGRAVGYLIGAAGIYLAASGRSIASGVWLLFIAMFLAQAARSVELQTAMTARIEHLRVADAVLRPSERTAGSRARPARSSRPRAAPPRRRRP